MLPPWPGWDGLHPLIIHFPIGLLLVAPLFVALAALTPKRGSTFAVSALVLLVLGTAGAVIAVETGEAAGELVTRTDAISRVLARHAELAETTRTVFVFLTLLYAALLILPLGLKKLARPAYTIVASSVFLAALLGANLLLANTAHQGGMLVHQLGVQAVMAPPAPTAAALPGTVRLDDDERRDRRD